MALAYRPALVLTGLLRDFELAQPNMHSKLIEPMRIDSKDVFIHVWDDRGYWYPGDAVTQKSFLESEHISESRIRKFYPNATIVVENFNDQRKMLENSIDDLPEVYLNSISHSNYLVRGINLASMFYKINAGLRLALAVNQISHIVRTRPDFVLKTPAPLFSEKFLKIAKQTNHLGQGVGDNFHLGPRKSMEPIMNIFESFDALFERTGGLVCPHLFVQKALEMTKTPYKQLRLPFETLHTPGGMYKAKNSDDNWVTLNKADYRRTSEPFKGRASLLNVRD